MDPSGSHCTSIPKTKAYIHVSWEIVCTEGHYFHVAWALMCSKYKPTRQLGQHLGQAINKANTTLNVVGHVWRESNWSSMDSPHKEPVVMKAFLCHTATMGIIEYISLEMQLSFLPQTSLPKDSRGIISNIRHSNSGTWSDLLCLRGAAKRVER